MILRTLVSHARLGPAEYRVLRPARPPVRAVLVDDDHTWSMYLDHEAARTLTVAWALAARSPRSLVYLPMRANVPPAGYDAAGTARVDLVLLHHSLQFPPSAWKRVRARLGPGRPHTASVVAADFPSTVDYSRWYHREFRDHIGFQVAAGTLFVVGSRTAFRDRADDIRSLVREGPLHPANRPRAGHFCVELSAGTWARPRTRKPVPGHLHIQYCPDWRR